AIDIARDHLWHPLAEDAKDRAAAWLGQIRGHAGYRNNHLFFDVLVLEFLGTIGAGQPGDRPAISYLMHQLESMHMGDGWFIDGTNESYDHYNAYAFHIYGLYWAHRYGGVDPERRDRWRGWARSFVPGYARCFSGSGEPVPIGRSLTYRFNGIGVFALARMNELEAMPAGHARDVCVRCIGYFTDKPIEQAQGCLSIGWTDHYEGIREPYSCAGSPYWAAKGFMALLLDRDDAFFTEKLASEPDTTEAATVALATPGWVTRDLTGGDREIINVGGVCSPGAAARFGSWRWGRFAYRGGTGVLVPGSPAEAAPDMALVATDPETRQQYDRVATIPTRCDANGAACYFALGSKATGFHVNVTAALRWHADWLLCGFRCTPHQRTAFSFGGFALACDAPLSSQTQESAASVRSTTSRASVVQCIAGSGKCAVQVASDEAARAHIYARHASVPKINVPVTEDRLDLIALVYAGPDNANAHPWRVVRTETSTGGGVAGLSLEHDTLGVWNARELFL
ncbi:MAG: DUF2264 domain-containing protein, partial [Planctomycetota bacterium]